MEQAIDQSHKQTFPSFTTTNALCPWFQQYHWYGGNEYIELPGQYDANYRPSMAKNLKIIRFERNIRVFQSLRKPIQLTVLTSDGHRYNYLVKYGEDLHQDERVQQMQTIMSGHLKNDKNCSQYRLRLRTYAVVPLNDTCGIISCVNDSKPIDDFVSSHMDDFHTRTNAARHQYESLRKYASRNKITEQSEFIHHLSREQVSICFR